MMKGLKGFLSRIKNKAKYIVSTMAVGCTAALATVVSSAAEVSEGSASGLSDYSSQIISQFTGAAQDIVPIVVGVMGAGLTIFVIFIGIKFGKKMFNTVSK